MAWGKFRKLLPIVASRHLSPKVRGRVYEAGVRSAMLHGSETWGPNAADLQRLRRNDRAMIRWICGVNERDEVSSDDLLSKLGISDICLVLRKRRLNWYGHVQRATSCINTVLAVRVPGGNRRGRPRKTWNECVQDDLKALDLSEAATQDRDAWRLAVRQSLVAPTPQRGTRTPR